MENLVFGNVFVHVQRKKMKNLRLVVKPPHGNVFVSAPKNLPTKQIVHFVEEKLDWIVQQQQLISKNHSPLQENQTVCVLGQNFVLHFALGKRTNFLTKGNDLFLRVTDFDPQTKQKAFDAFCKKTLQKALPGFFEKWQNKTGLAINGFCVKNMKTRWGSCNTKNKTICINLQVATKPVECLDYLVLHEIAHVIEPSHNQKFKDFLSGFMPDWKEIRKILKNN